MQSILRFLALTSLLACARSPEVAAEKAKVSEPKKAGDYQLSIDVGGVERSYRLHVPSTAKPTEKHAVIFVLHGGGAWAKQIEDMSRMDRTADANGFLAVYPNGTKGFFGYTWNGGDCCGVAMKENAKDVEFFSALIDRLVAMEGADPKRIYATGISNGGIMAYRLACDLSEKIAGIAPIAGSLMVADCKPKRPVSVIAFHGTKDQSVQIGGNFHKKSQPRRAFPPLAESLNTWKKFNQCKGEPKVVYQKGEVTCTRYGSCAEGTAVEYCKVEGGGHTWPGGEPIFERKLGHTTNDISASDAMWEFFKALRK